MTVGEAQPRGLLSNADSVTFCLATGSAPGAKLTISAADQCALGVTSQSRMNPSSIDFVSVILNSSIRVRAWLGWLVGWQPPPAAGRIPERDALLRDK